jgi:hypothetical protein
VRSVRPHRYARRKPARDRLAAVQGCWRARGRSFRLGPGQG